MIKQVAAYIRVSTDEQAREGLSIDGQIACIKNYCDMYFENYEITLFVDDGYSGRNVNRPRLKKLISSVDQFDCVAIWKLDRLSRSLIDAVEILKKFVSMNVDIVSVQERIDMTTAMGRAFVSIILIFAELEVENTSERTKMGLQQKARNGEYPFSKLPYGYVLTEKRKLVPDEKTKDMINSIYKQYYLEEKNINQIVKSVSEVYNHLSFKQLEKICHRVLKNDIYIGKFEYLGEVFENIVKVPIIDTNKLCVDGYKEIQFKSHEYKLSNVYCIHCGSVLSNSTTVKRNGNEYKYKVCNKCRKRVNQDKLIKLIVESKVDYMKNDLNFKKDFSFFYNFNNNKIFISMNK